MAYLSASISSADLVSLASSGNESRFPQSLSMPGVDELAMNEVLGTIVASWGPNILSRCLVSQNKIHRAKPTPFMLAFKVLKSQVLKLKCRVRALEAEVDDLKHACNLAHSDALEYRRELDTLRYDYFDKIAQNRKYAISSREDKEKIKLLEYKVNQAERFLLAMVDLKLHEPVLYGAAQSVLQGDDAENSLIDAILAASLRKASPWARIITAVVGPHTPGKCLSAITFALQSRKGLRQPHAIEIKNKDYPFNVDPIASSISQISDVASEVLSESRHEEEEPAVLDELLAILKAGDTTPKAVKHIRRVVAIEAQPAEEASQSSIPFKPLESIAVEMEKDSPGVKIDKVPSQTMSIDPFISRNNDQLASLPILHLDLEPAQIPTKADLFIGPKVMDEPENICPLIRPPSDASNPSSGTGTTMERSPPTTPQKNANKNLKTRFLRVNSPESSPPVTPKRTAKGQETSPRIKTPITARRIRVPTNSAANRSPPPSPVGKLLASSPVKSLGLSSKASTPRTPVQPLRPVNTSPIRSRLSTPKTNMFKRPVLQSINLNTPANVTVEQAIIKPVKIDLTLEESAERNSVKRSAKTLAKRCGVIMVDRDLLPGKAAAPTRSTTTNFSATSEHDPRSQFDSDTDTCSNANEANVTAGKDTDAGGSDFAPEPTSVASRAGAAFTVDARQPISTQAMSSLELLVDKMAREFSDSDLGSLEMTDSEDESDCEDLRMRLEQVDDLNDSARDLESLPDIRRSLDKFAGITSPGGVTDNDLDSEGGFYSDDDTEPTPVASFVARPSTPVVKPLAWAGTSPVPLVSSSSFASSGSTYSVSSPTVSKIPSKIPLMELNSRPGRSKSPTPVKKANSTPLVSSISPPVFCSGVSLPTSTGNFVTSKLPSRPRPARTAARPTVSSWLTPPKSDVVEERKVPATPKTSPPQKPSLLPLHSKTKNASTLQHSVSNSWTGRGTIGNTPSPKGKVVPSIRPSLSSLSPFSQTKPRANTINALSPLPPALSTPSPMALVAAAAATKPRSNTINTYSPISRSPLSRQVIKNTSIDSLDSPTEVLKSKLSSNVKKGQYQPRSALSSRMNTPASTTSISTKTTLPLRVNKKAAAKTRQTDMREPGPAPPTAAFMRPTVHPASSSTRRVSNSIAPLIPNWTPSSKNGVLSPTKCRNMFRNSLSMVVR